MKALTVWQPWATLIMEGLKPFEFRGWDFSARPNLRRLVGQRIVIHAGVRPVPAAEVAELIERLVQDPKSTGLVVAGSMDILDKLWRDRNLLPLGAALGTVVLGKPIRATEINHGTVDSDRADHQMFGWPVSEPMRFEPPRPMRGAQGFWTVPEDDASVMEGRK
jgi:hypothetical protein